MLKHGFMDASREWPQVEQWISDYPGSNWGLVTGEVSDLVVIDIDQKNGGVDRWEDLRNDFPEPFETVTSRTGGGGYHLWFRMPTGISLHSRAGVLGPGIDVRANGGYIVVPPSVTSSPYVFENPLGDFPVADLPDWLLSQLTTTTAPINQVNKSERLLIPQGQRHQVLVRYAVRMWHSGVPEEQIRDQLESIRIEQLERGDHPVTDHEIDDIIRWVKAHPREYLLTDLGNAERFVDQYGKEIHWYEPIGRWLIWNGKVWSLDDTKGIDRLAYQSIQNIYTEALNKINEDERKSWVRHALASQSQPRVSKMLESAKPYLSVTGNELDDNPYLLNVQNGVLDLRHTQLLAHDSNGMHSKIANVTYEPNSLCPSWLKFLGLITNNNQGITSLLQRAAGYSLTGLTDSQALFFIYGDGANGKSTFIETIRILVGTYGQKTDINSLLLNRSSGTNANPYIAQMAGARFVVASEVPDGRYLNEALVKDMTGGDAITARHLYKAPFTFTPTHKLWIIGNHKPVVRGFDDAIWRRIILIPFTTTIPEHERRPMSEVIDEFKNEMPGILNWALAGLQEWQKSNLKLPPAVIDATREYRSEQDVVNDFLTENCDMGGELSVSKDALFARWTTWCSKSGEREWGAKSRKWLTQQLTSRGYSLGGHGRSQIIGIDFRSYDRGCES